MVFVHKAIMYLVSNVESHAVATGLCDKLGNKGGIAIVLSIGKTKLCFLTAHLAAHQNQMDRRTAEFAKISREVVHALGPKENCAMKIDESTWSAPAAMRTSVDMSSGTEEEVLVGADDDDDFEDNYAASASSLRSSNNPDNCCFCPKCPNSMISQCSFCCGTLSVDRNDEKYNALPDTFDHVIWGGDLNFRVHGTRDIVDSLLAHNRHDILVDNDQLNMLMQFDKVFAGFVEGPLTFRPTYKFDEGSDIYDTSAKRRIPAWTDRILYKPSASIELLSYSSAGSVRSSDHRPVYASFQCSVDIIEEDVVGRIRRRIPDRVLLRSESKSEVCVIS